MDHQNIQNIFFQTDLSGIWVYWSYANTQGHTSDQPPPYSLVRKALGECVCQKVMQSAHHTETAQTSSVGCLNENEQRGGGSS